MKCPYCHKSTKVTNSRSRANGSQVWRRRTCPSCNATWTTREEIDVSTSHRVLSLGGLRGFSRDKLFLSIKDSLQHRKTALDDATALTDTIITTVLAQKTAQCTNAEISSITHEILSNFDKTAAAVYAAKHGLIL